MEKARKQKLLIIVALVFGIASLSIGFAAFSATLNISSSATVSPDSGNFNVIFSLSSDWHDDMDDLIDWELSGTATGNATASIGSLYGREISNLKANFTKPGEIVTYIFYAHNIGEYDAYFRGITYDELDNGSYKNCSASTTDSTKATDSLVQAACDGINITVSVGGTSYELGSTYISEHNLEKGTSEEIVFKIEYEADSSFVDGPFYVEFSDLELNYSTVNLKEISFVFNGTTYHAYDGMTWSEWISSDFNPSAEYCNYLCKEFRENNSILYGNELLVVAMADCTFVEGEELIIDNYLYNIYSPYKEKCLG